MEKYLQAKFVSKQDSIAVSEAQFSLPETSSIDELNGIVNKLVSDNNSDWSERQFDFLINGFILRGSLQDFIQENNFATEDVLIIECILREEAPRPEYSLPHEDWIGAVRVSDECLITGCYDNTIHIWSKEHDHLLTVPGHSGPVKCLAWVPTPDEDYKQFVSGSQDQTVILWKYELRKNRINCVQVGRGHERSVECVCSNFDGTRLASGSFDNYLKIWNTDSSDETTNSVEQQATKKFKTVTNKTVVKTPMVTLSGHREAVSGVCWSDVAEVITSSWDHSLILWDLELAGQKATLAGNKAFTCLSYSPLNSSIITGSCDRHVRLWDPRCKAVSSAKLTFTSHNGWVIAVDWNKSNENLFISSSYDQLMKLWDVRSPSAPLYDLIGHEDRLLCCDWSSPEYLASGGADNCVKIFSANKK